MERRIAERVSVSYRAELIYNEKSYAGIIENISKRGLKVITFSTVHRAHFKTGSMLELKFQTDSGDILNINCKVKWSSKISPDGLINRVGMEILNHAWEWGDVISIT